MLILPLQHGNIKAIAFIFRGCWNTYVGTNLRANLGTKEEGRIIFLKFADEKDNGDVEKNEPQGRKIFYGNARERKF